MNKILVVDDDEVILEALINTLSKAKYQVVSTTDPMKAYELYCADPTLVVISDIVMGEMSGKDFMLKLFEAGFSPLVIILTMMNDSKTIIDLFKSGAHDYIIKPFSASELVMKVNKAFELAELRIVNENIQKEREIRLEHQFNWNIFKDQAVTKELAHSDKGLIDGIKTSLLQGSGIGALVPLIDMIKQSAKPAGDDFIVKRKLLTMLFANAEFLNRLVDTIGDIDLVNHTDLPKEKITMTDFHQLVKGVVKSVSQYEGIRNHTVVLTKNLTVADEKRVFAVNNEYIKKAIQELLINAFKFSDEGTKVFILYEFSKDKLIMSFLNTPDPNGKEKNGIQPEYHSILFEPFFRLSRYVYENFPTLDFGLGLCTVDTILRNHKGKVRVGTLKNHIEPNKGVFINFSIEIPFAD